MKLDLIALKNRCLRAQRMGWVIASASQHAADLEAELGAKVAPPPGVKAGSPGHLVALIEAVQRKASVSDAELAAFEGPEVVHEPLLYVAGALIPEKLVEVELAADPEPEEGVEVELADEPEPEEGEELEVLPYEEMTYQQLVDEARDRNLPGRRGTSKVDLLEMLKQDDEA